MGPICASWEDKYDIHEEALNSLDYDDYVT